jgi:cytochrome o ubiquinol oxidase subunit 2
MNICWNRIRLALVALACVGLSGCDWVLLDSKGMVGLAQRPDPDLHRPDADRGDTGHRADLRVRLAPSAPATLKAKYTPDWSHHQGGDRGLGRAAADHRRLAVIVWKSTHELDPYAAGRAGEPLPWT